MTPFKLPIMILMSVSPNRVRTVYSMDFNAFGNTRMPACDRSYKVPPRSGEESAVFESQVAFRLSEFSLV